MKNSKKILMGISFVVVIFLVSNINNVLSFDLDPGDPPPSDTTPPSIEITSPSQSETVSGYISICAIASDNEGVNFVSFQLGGSSIGVDYTAAYVVNIDTQQYTSGSYLLRATAVDVNGNSASDSITINIFNYHKLTIPSGKFVDGYTIINSYGIGYHVDTEGSSQYGYYFMGYSDYAVKSSSEGEISMSGYFRQSDTFSSSQQPNRRYLRAYVLSTDLTSIVTSVKVLDHNYGTSWYFREFTISGLDSNQNYKIAFGRRDSWSTDWKLTSEWAGIEIDTGSPATIEGSVYSLNHGCQGIPGVIIAATLGSIVLGQTITDSNGEYSIVIENILSDHSIELKASKEYSGNWNAVYGSYDVINQETKSFTISGDQIYTKDFYVEDTKYSKSVTFWAEYQYGLYIARFIFEANWDVEFNPFEVYPDITFTSWTCSILSGNMDEKGFRFVAYNNHPFDPEYEVEYSEETFLFIYDNGWNGPATGNPGYTVNNYICLFDNTSTWSRVVYDSYRGEYSEQCPFILITW